MLKPLTTPVLTIMCLLLSFGAIAAELPEPDADAIVGQIGEALNEVYVFPEVATQMNEHMRERLQAGAYKGMDLETLTGQLTEDLQSVSHDLHLSVGVIQPEDLSTGREIDEEARHQRYLERARRMNYGFSTLENLQGNVGYLELHGFYDAALGGATAVAAMNFLSSSDALIIDLRQNGGGSPSMIQLITSYLFDERQHLNSFYVRRNDSMQQFWTQEFVEGPRMPDIPVWVLTSNRTFSAAEEFSYNLKHMQRARIIGETTGGGAHPVEDHDFPELGVRMYLPFGRAINPITGTNWEGTGVVPHESVAAADALIVAHAEALTLLAGQSDDDAYKASLQWALTGLNAQANPVPLSVLQLGDYPGTFGPRRIWQEDSALRYQRDGGPMATLVPMGDDLFGLENVDDFRIRFERNSSGQVRTLVGLYADGRAEPNAKE